MKVTVQSSNLSSLAPRLQVYNSSRSLLGQTSAPNTFGATISLSSSVASGQGYYVKVTDAGGAAPAGNYGLLLNFGSSTQSPIPPPNTVVAQQPDGGGGTINNVVVAGGGSTLGNSSGGLGSGQGNFTAIGALSGWVEDMAISQSSPTNPGSSNLTETVARSERRRGRSEFHDCLSPVHARWWSRGHRRDFEWPILHGIGAVNRRGYGASDSYRSGRGRGARANGIQS